MRRPGARLSAPSARGAVAVGDAGLLVAVRGPAEARALAAAVSRARWPGVLDAVGGLRSVLLVVSPGEADPKELAERVERLEPAAGAGSRPRTHRLPVTLDGPDRDEVCRRAGLTPAGLADVLAASVLEVAMLGFSPGFAYLTGLPRELSELPRRPAPRPSVPAGSVALAGGFAAVYPQSTPGGWQVVGRTPSRLFDPRTPPYALLRPGDSVRLDPLAHDRVGPASVPGGSDRAPRRALRPPPGSAAVLCVEEAGLLTTVQDGGRAALAHLGVPGAGPADPLAHALANLLVGNPWSAPALEVTARGPVLRCTAPVYVAVVGADPEVTVDGREVGAGHVVPLAAGQRLAVGAVRSGLRCAVAVAGGLAVPGVLGSCSTDLLCGLGPGPLVAGDVLGSGGAAGPMGDHLGPGAPGLAARPTGTRVLRVLPGPHGPWFPGDAFERLSGARFVVEAASDRVGVRLTPADGGAGIVRRPGELDSQGMVTGAVQVPSDGRPVVLGPDHATVGGYPVVAVVAGCDRWLLGQCRPGDVVELAPVGPEEAATALGALRRAAAGAVVGRYPSVPA